jgi:hypothetical protein
MINFDNLDAILILKQIRQFSRAKVFFFIQKTPLSKIVKIPRLASNSASMPTGNVH